MVVDIIKLLIPLRKGLQIHRPEIFDSPLPQMRHEMATDEAAGPGHKDGRLRMRLGTHSVAQK